MLLWLGNPDRETADIAIRASLTGHLVLSTLTRMMPQVRLPG